MNIDVSVINCHKKIAADSAACIVRQLVLLQEI